MKIIVHISIILIMTAIYSSGSVAAPNKSSNSISKDFLLNRGKSNFSNRRFFLAAIDFSSYISSNPEPQLLGEALLGYAQSLYSLGELSSAKEQYLLLSHSSEFPLQLQEIAQLHLALDLEETISQPTKKVSSLLTIWKARNNKEEFQSLIQQKNVPEKLRLQLQDISFQPISYKSPTFAAVSSAIIPGSGQAYAGLYQTAAISFLLNGVFLLSTIELAKKDLKFSAAVSGVVFSSLYIGNIVGAVNGVKSYNASTSEARDHEIKESLLSTP